jgi:hypothetical protein
MSTERGAIFVEIFAELRDLRPRTSERIQPKTRRDSLSLRIEACIV